MKMFALPKGYIGENSTVMYIYRKKIQRWNALGYTFSTISQTKKEISMELTIGP